MVTNALIVMLACSGVAFMLLLLAAKISPVDERRKAKENEEQAEALRLAAEKKRKDVKK